MAAETDAMAGGLVEVRDTKTAKGAGLYAMRDIACGTWLGEYTGEVLTQESYLQRYPLEDAEYVLCANTDYNIDAVDPERSSFLRFVNHSGTPNCFYDVRKVRKQRAKHVYFFTARDIAAGEELTFDYGKEYWSGRKAPV